MCVPDLVVLVVCVAFACGCCRRLVPRSSVAAGASLPGLLPGPPFYVTSHHLKNKKKENNRNYIFSDSCV